MCIFNEFNQLVTVNDKMKANNKGQLVVLQKEIKNHMDKAYKILNDIDVRDGPIQYKFGSARLQIEALYKEIEAKISKVQEFESMLLLHSGRIKKIVLTNFIDFLNFQK